MFICFCFVFADVFLLDIQTTTEKTSTKICVTVAGFVRGNVCTDQQYDTWHLPSLKYTGGQVVIVTGQNEAAAFLLCVCACACVHANRQSFEYNCHGLSDGV